MEGLILWQSNIKNYAILLLGIEMVGEKSFDPLENQLSFTGT